MSANLRLVSAIPAVQDIHKTDLRMLVPNRSGAANSGVKEKSSKSLVALIIAIHLLPVVWLGLFVSKQENLEKVQMPMMVSLLSTPERVQKEVSKNLPAQPVIRKQPLVKEKLPVIESPAKMPVAKEKPVQESPVVHAQEAATTTEIQHTAKSTEAVKETESKRTEAEPEVEPPKFGAAYLNNPAPEYPQLARRKGEQGRVMLKVLVSESGQPEKVQVDTSSGYSKLDQAAVEAVKKWSFIPASRSGQPVSAYVLVPIKFSLNG